MKAFTCDAVREKVNAGKLKVGLKLRQMRSVHLSDSFKDLSVTLTILSPVPLKVYRVTLLLFITGK